jgi:hypothetical protein
MEELLEWDISQNTETAWSSQVGTKTKVRRTYSRRQDGSFLKRSASLPVTSPGTSLSDDEGNAARQELGEEVVSGPPLPIRRTFARSNSVTMYDRKQPPQMKRANSISIVSRRRSASTSLLSDFNENRDPNLDSPLEDYISPKRSKPIVDTAGRGRKKVRSETNQKIPKMPIPDSFSNLAKVGEDGLSWAKPSASFGSSTPSMKETIANDFDFNLSEASPATTVGSNRKRGICESPVDDFDECSFSAPSVRRSRLTPTSTAIQGTSTFSFTPTNKEGDTLHRDTGSSESQRKRDMEFETDDGDSLSDGDDSEATTESNFKSEMQNFTPFGSAQRRQSSMSFFPDNLLDPAKSGPVDVIKSMTSYQDLRFLVKSLRKEKMGSRTSWHVAPPVAWDTSRRAAFFQWTTQSLGFSFRAGGMAIAYLQISKSKGAEFLELLESAVLSYKQKGLGEKTPKDTCEKRHFAFSSSKNPLNTNVSRTLALTPKE